jgi:hypothetical protein
MVKVSEICTTHSKDKGQTFVITSKHLIVNSDCSYNDSDGVTIWQDRTGQFYAFFKFNRSSNY